MLKVVPMSALEPGDKFRLVKHGHEYIKANANGLTGHKYYYISEYWEICRSDTADLVWVERQETFADLEIGDHFLYNESEWVKGRNVDSMLVGIGSSKVVQIFGHEEVRKV